MGKVRGYTERQRREYNIDKQKNIILKGLHAYKGFNHMTIEGLAKEFGMSVNSMCKILKGGQIRMTCAQWLRMVDIAGMEVKKVENAENN